jgi:tetraacyldisaccharide 4'-kinase
MKTPAFWYRPRGIVAHLLRPLGLLYKAGGAMRGMRATPYRARVPLICVGNITAGGSGKTPAALAIAHILQHDGHRPVFVTRGYGGKESGPLLVDRARHTANDVGDEALLLSYAAQVWVGRDRAKAIREAEKDATHIILDDGLQNPHLQPDLSFLVIDDEIGLGNGCIIPAGPLREPLTEALKRVAAVILVGGRFQNDAMLADAGVVKEKIVHARLQPDIPLGFPRDRSFFAFAGIGQPQKFYQTCRVLGLRLVGTRDFADHHLFTAAELSKLKQNADRLGAQLLTTEKDWMRLPAEFRAHTLSLPVRLIFEEPDRVKRLLNAACQKTASAHAH